MHNDPPVTAGDFSMDDFKKITNEVDAAVYFGAKIEGFGVAGDRWGDATDALKMYGGKGGGSSSNGGDCGGKGGSPDCASASGNAKILCEAKKYDRVDYVWGGGHAGGSAYHKACPTIESNSSACGLDCSGLVSVSIFDAFGGSGSLAWNTNSLRTDTANWQEVSFDKIEAGDVIEPDSEHVEIVDHVKGSTIHTFGAHSANKPQPDQVGGDTTYTHAPSYKYYRYIGQGSS
jgi:hypothetical protein